MALTKQQISVNFQRGLDTKTDPWQVAIGNFLELENSVFTKGGLLQKRNGFQQIGSINDQTVTSITTFNNELTLLGQNIYSYNQPLQSFVNQGPFYSVEFSKLNLIADSYDQTQVDSVTAPNGLICCVFYEASRTTSKWNFVIIDSLSGQAVTSIQTLTPNTGTIYAQGYGKTFYFQNKFIIIFPVTNGANTELQFIAIDSTTLVVSPAVTICTTYKPDNAGTLNSKNWDAAVGPNNIVIGFNSSANTFFVNTIYSNLSVGTPTLIDNTLSATNVCGTCDGNNFYFSYVDNNTGNGNVVGISLLSGTPTKTFSPQQFLTACPYAVLNLATIVNGTTINILYELVTSVYYYFPSSYPASTQVSDQIDKRTCSTSGVLGAAPTSSLIKGAGLASRAFLFAGDFYFAICYSKGNNSTSNPVSTNQGCYFLVNSSGDILTQFAYGNGNGWYYYNLPNVSVQQFYGSTIIGSNTINGITNTANLKVGQKIISTSFPLSNTYIQSIDSTSSITVSRPATITGNTVAYLNNVEFPYLYANVIQPLGLPTPTSSTVAIYNSYASALAQIELFKERPQSIETGNNLNISSGFLWGYDGYQATENNFFVYPDSIYAEAALSSSGHMEDDTYFYRITYEWTDNQGNLFRSTPSVPFELIIYPSHSITGDTTNLSAVIKNISDTTQLQKYQKISGAGIPLGAYVVSIDSSTQITISSPATATAVGVNLSVTAVSAANIYVPTLRLSYKNDVNIVVYRYSTKAPAYYQLGIGNTNSVFVTKNDPTVDFVTIVDKRAINNDYTTGIFGVVGNALLYTTGGVVENTRTPPCSAMTLFDGRLWFIDSENSNLWYSKQIFQSTPVEMSDLFTYYINPSQIFQNNSGKPTAISVLDDKLIIFKRNEMLYINGIGPDDTGANSQYSEPILITATVGCSNPNSIAIIPQGLICQSNKGIWLLGRDLSTSYIGAPVEKFTEGAIVVSAQTIPGTNQVRFSLNNGIMLVYDYYYNQWGTFTGINSIETAIYNGLHTVVDNYGRIAQETINNYTDISNPVLMKFRTNWFALGGIQGFQRAYFFFLLGKYYSPHKLNVEIAYDFNDGFTQSAIINPENYSSVFGSDPFYGSSEFWGGPSQVEKWRVMLTKQKCDSLQFKLSEIYDPSYGTKAGAGLTISGMNIIIGVKKGYGPISQFNTTS